MLFYVTLYDRDRRTMFYVQGSAGESGFSGHSRGNKSGNYVSDGVPLSSNGRSGLFHLAFQKKGPGRRSLKLTIPNRIIPSFPGPPVTFFRLISLMVKFWKFMLQILMQKIYPVINNDAAIPATGILGSGMAIVNSPRLFSAGLKKMILPGFLSENASSEELKM